MGNSIKQTVKDTTAGRDVNSYNAAHITIVKSANETVKTPPLNNDFKTSEQIKQSKETAARAVINNLADDVKRIYGEKLRLFNPFSLPFTFDIERTWISLGLGKDNEKQNTRRNDSEKFIRMEDHCQLIKEAFASAPRLLLIEGRAASGKTSLLRRIAYDWAKGKLGEFTLVLLMEFRHLPKKSYASIAEMVLSGSQTWTECNDISKNKLGQILFSSKYCLGRILLLLDGFDEAKSIDVCTELTNYLNSSSSLIALSFHLDIVISSRPGPLTSYKGQKGRMKFAEVLGFDERVQRNAYIDAHFSNGELTGNSLCIKIETVKTLLRNNEGLEKLAETPLFLTFICLVHEHLKEGTIFELYRCIIWWLIDRYQKDHPDLDVPTLFGYKKSLIDNLNGEIRKLRTIQDHFLEFPVLRDTGHLAFKEIEDSTFFTNVINKYLKGNVQTINSGIILRDEYRENLRMSTRYLFPHRTIQEFLAGSCFYFWSDHFEIQSTIDTFLQSNKKYEELEKFIFCSISSQTLPRAVRRYIEKQSILHIDISSFQCAKSVCFTDAMNAVLRCCKKVRELTLTSHSDVCLTEPLDLTQLTQKLEMIKVDVRKFNFEENRSRSIINLSTTSNSTGALKKIELHGIRFPSSETLVHTIKVLVNNTRKQTTLELTSVKVRMNSKKGLKRLFIFSDACPISSFLAKGDGSNSSFLTELSYVLNYLACIKEIWFDGDKNNAAFFDYYSLLASFNSLKYLQKMQYWNLSIETEEKLAGEHCSAKLKRKLDGLDAIEQVTFGQCKFRSDQHVILLLNYLTKQIQRSEKAVSAKFVACTVSFPIFSNIEKIPKFSSEVQLSEYSGDWAIDSYWHF